MHRLHLGALLRHLIVSIALYPVVFLGIWALFVLSATAAELHLAADATPWVYGLMFALLTVSLIDILGLSCVVLVLVACANLIEYTQLLIPGRSASAVDFAAGAAGIAVAATLVWAARGLVERQSPDGPAVPGKAYRSSRQ